MLSIVVNRRKIKVVEYQENWGSKFTAEAELLISITGFLKPSIQAIGDTPVPELAAKPIVDIQVEAEDVNILGDHSDKFEDMGYHSGAR